MCFFAKMKWKLIPACQLYYETSYCLVKASGLKEQAVTYTEMLGICCQA